MIKSLLRYTRFFSYSLFFTKERNILFHDFKRAFLGQKVQSNVSINPWSDKTYSNAERASALDQAVTWLLHAQNSMKDDGFGSYHITDKWTSSYVETSGYIIPTLLN